MSRWWKYFLRSFFKSLGCMSVFMLVVAAFCLLLNAVGDYLGVFIILATILGCGLISKGEARQAALHMAVNGFADNEIEDHLGIPWLKVGDWRCNGWQELPEKEK